MRSDEEDEKICHERGTTCFAWSKKGESSFPVDPWGLYGRWSPEGRSQRHQQGKDALRKRLLENKTSADLEPCCRESRQQSCRGTLGRIILAQKRLQVKEFAFYSLGSSLFCFTLFWAPQIFRGLGTWWMPSITGFYDADMSETMTFITSTALSLKRSSFYCSQCLPSLPRLF